MKFQCDACSRTVDHDPVKRDMANPPGWGMRDVQGKRFLLCESCGHPAAFHGGISRGLKIALCKRHGLKLED